MSEHSASLEHIIDRLRRHDEGARSELIERSQGRLLRLTRKMLTGFPGVRRWEDTDDIFQNATMRLWRSLEKFHPETAVHFFNLAALQIRRELIELARRYGGPLGLGANLDTPPPQSPTESTQGSGRARLIPSDSTHESSQLAIWTEFHESIDELPAEERETFALVWYQGLSHGDVANLIGVSERTISRRWQKARRLLSERFGSRLPG